MTGCHKDFLAYLKQEVPDFITVHCIIHCQHFSEKNLNECLLMLMLFLVNAINMIRGNSLSDRLFYQFSIKNDEDCNRLLLHTEVGCISKEISLNRF